MFWTSRNPETIHQSKKTCAWVLFTKNERSNQNLVYYLFHLSVFWIARKVLDSFSEICNSRRSKVFTLSTLRRFLIKTKYFLDYFNNSTERGGLGDTTEIKKQKLCGNATLWKLENKLFFWVFKTQKRPKFCIFRSLLRFLFFSLSCLDNFMTNTKIFCFTLHKAKLLWGTVNDSIS